MITLTTPAQVNSVLGGNTQINYDRMVIAPMSLDPVGMTITGRVRLTSSANPDMPSIDGSLAINCGTAVLEVTVERLDFYRRVRLTSPQNDAVMTIIRNTQNSIESGLINLGVVAGVQAAGV
jgi:hypothetical protein